MNALSRVFIFVSLLFAMTTSVFADPPRASHDHWRNTNVPSHYVMYDNASRTYLETINCRIAYRFTLVSNEMNTLTIFDASRNMTVRLNYEGMFLKAAGATNFTFYQPGTFDTRTQFKNMNPNGTHASNITKQHACVWQEWFLGARGPAYNFVEKNTNASSVELYDVSRNMWVRLDTAAMFLKVGNAAYSFFHSGHW